jgi:hypothetical protein
MGDAETTGIERAIGRLEGKMDLLIDMHASNEKRVGAVEKKVWWASGAAGVIAVILEKMAFNH